jgi:hypothetical protein
MVNRVVVARGVGVGIDDCRGERDLRTEAFSWIGRHEDVLCGITVLVAEYELAMLSIRIRREPQTRDSRGSPFVHRVGARWNCLA